MNRKLILGVAIGLVAGLSIGAMQVRRSGYTQRFHFVPMSDRIAWCMDDQYGTFYYLNLDDKETPIRNLGTTGNAAGRKRFE